MTAHRWQPGESGNPSGRPKRRLLTDALDAELRKLAKANGERTKAEAMVARLVNIVLTGDRSESIAAAKLLWSYHEGQPTQPIELELRRAARDIAEQTGADADWLVKRAQEIAARASEGAAV